MKRRQFIKYSIAGSVAISAFGAGIVYLTDSADKAQLNIDVALMKLDILSTKKVANLGEWDLSQILTHCAQSVEYSMSGFPEHKSTFFKETVGQLAFSVFSARGSMNHALNEPIPGAPALTSAENMHVGLDRLKIALVAFQQYEGTLEPHFAYGALSIRDYEIAHVMHLYNHLLEIKV
jgi:hypothetical protein